MIELGKRNRLLVTRRSEIGVFVDGGDDGEILLPRSQVDESMQPGSELDLFIYHDSKQRLVATTAQTLASVGECAWLRVVSLGRPGAFLDWGLPKDLLLPFGEQQRPLRVGQSCAAWLYVDPRTRRVVASTRLEQQLSSDVAALEPRMAVDCLVYGRSDLGFKAVINHRYLGQFYDNETFRRLRAGDRVVAWVRRIRSDGKIDLVLQQASNEQRDQLGEAILAYLQRNDGESTLTDHSPPDDIYREFGVSKASYKKALGRLYKRRDIEISRDRIRLV